VRRRKATFKNRGAPDREAAVGAIAREQPAGGQLRAATAVAQRGSPSSAAGGRGVGERHPREKLNHRVRALAAQGAQERPSLTAAPRAAGEKAQVEKEAPGECESAGPGYGGCRIPSTAGR